MTSDTHFQNNLPGLSDPSTIENYEYEHKRNLERGFWTEILIFYPKYWRLALELGRQVYIQ